MELGEAGAGSEGAGEWGRTPARRGASARHTGRSHPRLTGSPLKAITSFAFHGSHTGRIVLGRAEKVGGSLMMKLTNLGAPTITATRIKR